MYLLRSEALRITHNLVKLCKIVCEFVTRSLEYDRLTELFIPKFNKKIGRPRSPWLTNNVLKLVALKKKLWQRNQLTKRKINSLVVEYQKVRNEVKKESKRAVASFEQSLANDK